MPSSPWAAAARSGYARGPHPPTPDGPREVAILAGGCFWGWSTCSSTPPGSWTSRSAMRVEPRSRRPMTPGNQGSSTGHAESGARDLRSLRPQPSRDLLVHWYFRGHNHDHARPASFQRHRPQYRSEIFTLYPPARAKAAASREDRVARTGKWGFPIVTKIEGPRPRGSAPETITRTIW
ncbi:MAG: peptide-methionine (S)-S-oxide reductase [Myxococcales bacterium]|nr:peptide-methionine (S)-S-oxide reductase [Myxococcales bacterium]